VGPCRLTRSWFSNWRCTKDPDDKIKASVLYAAYQAWCQDNGEKAVLAGTAFGRRTAEQGVARVSTAKGRVYRGIGLK
jgi:phage/plasmid-associated DNA primase